MEKENDWLISFLVKVKVNNIIIIIFFSFLSFHFILFIMVSLRSESRDFLVGKRSGKSRTYFDFAYFYSIFRFCIKAAVMFECSFFYDGYKRAF